MLDAIFCEAIWSGLLQHPTSLHLGYKFYVGKATAGGVEGAEQQQMALARHLRKAIRNCYLKPNQTKNTCGEVLKL